MTLNITTLVDNVTSTLGDATGLTYAQSYDELSEGMQDTPTLQVYWESIEEDPTTTTERTTFQAGVRQKDIVIHADLYARRRSQLDEDMGAMLPLVDAIIDVLEAQDTKPYFATAEAKAFSWTANRATFTYADPQVSYVGARFVLRFRVF
jgi:hypothetical protein